MIGRVVAVLLLAMLVLAGPSNAYAQEAAGPLPSVSEVVNGRHEVVVYHGRRAVRLVPAPELEGRDANVLGIIEGAEFHDGTIEIDVAGTPRPGAPTDSRGFVGISFRTGPHAAWSEVFYLRPLNGRAEDQVRRNRAAQYAFDPEFPWHRLRRESPGQYESYVDLEDGVWTRLRIEVAGNSARLFVNGASQPTLVVNGLKGGDRAGRIALWSHVETDAHFAGIGVTPR